MNLKTLLLYLLIDVLALIQALPIPYGFNSTLYRREPTIGQPTQYNTFEADVAFGAFGVGPLEAAPRDPGQPASGRTNLSAPRQTPRALSRVGTPPGSKPTTAINRHSRRGGTPAASSDSISIPKPDGKWKNGKLWRQYAKLYYHLMVKMEGERTAKLVTKQGITRMLGLAMEALEVAEAINGHFTKTIPEQPFDKQRHAIAVETHNAVVLSKNRIAAINSKLQSIDSSTVDTPIISPIYVPVKSMDQKTWPGDFTLMNPDNVRKLNDVAVRID